MTPEELLDDLCFIIEKCPDLLNSKKIPEEKEAIELIRKVKKEWCIEFAEFCTGIKREFIENGYEKFLNAPEPE